MAMANKGFAKAPIIIGAIFQGVMAFIFVCVAISLYRMTGAIGGPLGGMSPEELAIQRAQLLTMVGYFGFLAILALVFVVLWFLWVRNPKDHERGFKITCILGIIFMVLLPAFLEYIMGNIIYFGGIFYLGIISFGSYFYPFGVIFFNPFGGIFLIMAGFLLLLFYLYFLLNVLSHPPLK